MRKKKRERVWTLSFKLKDPGQGGDFVTPRRLQLILPLLAHLHKGPSTLRWMSKSVFSLNLSIRSSISKGASALRVIAAQFPARCARLWRFEEEFFAAVLYMWILIPNRTRSCSGLRAKKEKGSKEVVDAVGSEEQQTTE